MNINPGYAEFGSVQQVNTEDYSLEVYTDSGKSFDRVLWASPWVSNEGQGMYAMPQVGSRVLLVYPDGSDRPIAVGWVPFRDENGSYKGKKEDLHQGDQVLKTPDGAMIILRTGGLIEIYSSEMNHWSFIPLSNTTRGVMENLELITLGGKIYWRHDRNTRKTTFTALFKDDAIGDHKLQMEFGHIDDGSVARILYDDPGANLGEGNTAQIRIGDLGFGHVLDVNVNNQIDVSLGKDRLTETLLRANLAEGDQAITIELGKNAFTGALLNAELNDGTNTLELQFGSMSGDALVAKINSEADAWNLVIKPDGTTTLTVAGETTILEIDPIGNVTLIAEGDVAAYVEGDIVAEVQGDVVASVTGDMSAYVDGFIHYICNEIYLGSHSSGERLVLGDLFKAFYNTFIGVFRSHNHIGNLGSPTGPPLQSVQNFGDDLLSDKAKTEK